MSARDLTFAFAILSRVSTDKEVSYLNALNRQTDSLSDIKVNEKKYNWKDKTYLNALINQLITEGLLLGTRDGKIARLKISPLGKEILEFRDAIESFHAVFDHYRRRARLVFSKRVSQWDELWGEVRKGRSSKKELEFDKLKRHFTDEWIEYDVTVGRNFLKGVLQRYAHIPIDSSSKARSIRNEIIYYLTHDAIAKHLDYRASQPIIYPELARDISLGVRIDISADAIERNMILSEDTGGYPKQLDEFHFPILKEERKRLMHALEWISKPSPDIWNVFKKRQQSLDERESEYLETTSHHS